MIVAENPAEAPDSLARDSGLEPITLCLPPEWRLTDQALLAISSLNEATQFERSEEGALIISFAAGWPSANVGAVIIAQVVGWSVSSGGGQVGDSSAGFRLPGGAVRSPDVSWISPDQLAQLEDDHDPPAFPPFCPPFVVEVVSSRDSVAAQQRKMGQWLDYGVRLGWLIDRQRSLAWIYRPGQQEPELLDRPSELSGDDVLPGLTVECSRIWKPVKSGDSE